MLAGLKADEWANWYTDPAATTDLVYSGGTPGPAGNMFQPAITGPITYYARVYSDGGLCESTVVLSVDITITSPPAQFNMTGGGLVCSGSNGTPVGLDGSVAGVSYQLQLDGSDTGSPLAGTGAALDFGLQTAAGTYTVVATTDGTACSAVMTGSAVVTGSPLAAPAVVPGSNSPVYLGGGALLLSESGGDAVSWDWSGPGGFSSTDQNPMIANPAFADAGAYTVTVTSANGCTNAAGTVVGIYHPIAITCPDDVTMALGSGECNAVINYPAPVVTSFNGAPTVVQTSGLPAGEAFPIGLTTNCFQATDPLNYTATCCFSVTVQEYPNPVPTLVCIDMVTISLGESCQVVVTADMILDGGPYGCFNDYIVELDKLAPFGNGPWVQPAEVNAGDIGHTYQIRVIAPVSGNSCWSSVYVQDVLPPAMTCSDVVVDCTAPGLTPPAVTDCRTFTLTWNDIAVVDNFPALPHKIITRKWTATDAGGNTATCIQTVSVTDNGGPAANCPADMTVSTDPLACCATVDLPDVVLENISGGIANTTAIIFVRDPVTGDTVAQIDVPGVLSNFPGNNPNNPDTLAVFGLTPCLPLGQHDVAYLACGNAAYCTFRLTVEDNTPPVVVCDEFTTVALGAGCMVLLDAAAFDNGSYDNCSSVFFKVRRLGGNGCEPDDRFYDQMKFCAADLGQTLQIVLRVYAVPVPAGGVDAAFEESNASDCVVEVAVQDKLKPTCTAPGHVTVSCENFDPSLFAYGFATGADNCCLDTVTVTDNRLLFDSICNRGTITRTFRAFDCGGLTSTCTQRIVVNYNQNFYIKFPDDVLATDCSPSGNYGEPEFFGVDCELIGVSPEDVVIPVVPDACFKIERTWTVVNWCNYDPNLGCTEVPNPNPQPNPNHPANRPGPTVSEAGAQAPWAPTVVAILPGQQPTNFSSFWSANANCYKYTQIIKVIDSHGPVVENCPTGPVQMCDPTANNADLWNEPYWQDAPANSNDLNECPAELSLTVTDLCSGSNLTVRYLLFLDLDNDGTMETVVSSANLPGFNTVNFGNVQTPNFSGGTPRQFDERPVPTNEKYGFALQTTTNGSNKTARVRWNTQQVPNAYTVPELPYGTHKIKWFVEDACGNEAVCEYMFSVKTDCEPPIVVCNNCVSVSLPQAQTVTLGVADFLQQAQDNTTPTNLLVTAIRRAGTGTGFPANPQTSLTFGCAEIGVQQVEVWVKDEAGNTASCVSALVVGDNDGVCGAAYPNLEFCAGTTTPSAILLSGPVPGATYSWTNDNPGIGLGSGGTDYIPQFPAENFCPTPMTGTIQVQANYASAGLSCPNPPPASFTITVHPAPIVLFPGDQVWCPGETTMAIEFMGTLPGMTYAWTNNNTGIGLAANGTGDIPSFAVANGGNLPNTATITVLGTGANSPLCPDPVPTTFTITANPTPVVADPGDQVICAGDVTAPVAFAANMAVSGFSWTNDNPAIGLPASGTGDIAAFLTANNTGTPMTATITVAPVVGDKEAPTVICTNGLVANILGNGLLALYAVDFLQSAQDNVTLANQLKISIRKAGMGSGFPVDQQGNPVPYVIFDCTQTGNQVVEVWAEDACGNANFCEATVNVQAGPGVCASGPGSISGKAATEYGDGVSGVVVSLNGPGVSRSVVTGSDGGFSFNNLPDGQAYQLCLEKGSDPLNGVNSFDLVLLSQHILGVNPFNSPYTIIAGEVNESGTVTDLDIVEIRKLILHIVQDLPVPSWRFVPADHVFPNPANPYLDAIPFGCKTVQLNGSAPNQDFVAIKTADFNGSAVANRPAPAPETAGKSAAAASTSDCESCPVQPAEFTITILPQLSLAPVPASPSCNGTTDGSISANASGGTPPYQYALGGGGFQNNAVFGNLGVGTYTITVKDANGCTAQQQAALPQGPDQPLAIQCPAGIPALTADARCRATIPDYTALATLSGGCNIPLNPMVQTPAPGTLVNPGTVAITLTVSNTAGQSAKCVFNVTIGGGCGGN
ncbi:MAG: HYR domain-containing protein [Saprospiraceae bacterium]